MTGGELADVINSNNIFRAASVVAVMVKNHPPFIVKGVDLEYDEDSHTGTLWIKANEY